MKKKRQYDNFTSATFSSWTMDLQMGKVTVNDCRGCRGGSHHSGCVWGYGTQMNNNPESWSQEQYCKTGARRQQNQRAGKEGENWRSTNTCCVWGIKCKISIWLLLPGSATRKFISLSELQLYNLWNGNNNIWLPECWGGYNDICL